MGLFEIPEYPATEVRMCLRGSPSKAGNFTKTDRTVKSIDECSNKDNNSIKALLHHVTEQARVAWPIMITLI